MTMGKVQLWFTIKARLILGTQGTFRQNVRLDIPKNYLIHTQAWDVGRMLVMGERELGIQLIRYESVEVELPNGQEHCLLISLTDLLQFRQEVEHIKTRDIAGWLSKISKQALEELSDKESLKN